MQAALSQNEQFQITSGMENWTTNIKNIKDVAIVSDIYES